MEKPTPSPPQKRNGPSTWSVILLYWLENIQAKLFKTCKYFQFNHQYNAICYLDLTTQFLSLTRKNLNFKDEYKNWGRSVCTHKLNFIIWSLVRDWLKKLVPLCHPIRIKTKTYCDSLMLAFLRFVPVTMMLLCGLYNLECFDCVTVLSVSILID